MGRSRTAKLQNVAAIFRLLSNSTRLQLLCEIGRNPTTVIELAELTGVSASTIGHHLSYLRIQGLIEPQRSRTVVYVASGPARQILRAVGLLPAQKKSHREPS